MRAVHMVHASVLGGPEVLLSPRNFYLSCPPLVGMRACRELVVGIRTGGRLARSDVAVMLAEVERPWNVLRGAGTCFSHLPPRNADLPIADRVSGGGVFHESDG